MNFVLKRFVWAVAFVFFGCDEASLVSLPPPSDAGVDIAARKPKGPEVCDGIDNDRNGVVDDIPLEFFYPDGYGPPLGECKPAVGVCRDGQVVFEGLVLPQEEIHGNDRDDDCDGSTDECNLNEIRQYAIAADGSGSMNAWKNPMRRALVDLDNTRHDYALAMYGGLYNASVVVSSGWGEGLEGNYLDMHGSNEYSVEAVFHLLEEEPWEHSEREKIVVIVTDEQPQHSYPGNDGIEDLINDCLQNDYKVSVVTQPHMMEMWRPLTQACDGWLMDLNTPALAESIMGEALCENGEQ